LTPPAAAPRTRFRAFWKNQKREITLSRLLNLLFMVYRFILFIFSYPYSRNLSYFIGFFNSVLWIPLFIGFIFCTPLPNTLFHFTPRMTTRRFCIDFLQTPFSIPTRFTLPHTNHKNYHAFPESHPRFVLLIRSRIFSLSHLRYDYLHVAFRFSLTSIACLRA